MNPLIRLLVFCACAVFALGCGDGDQVRPARALLDAVVAEPVRLPAVVVGHPSEIRVTDSARVRLSSWPTFPDDVGRRAGCLAEIRSDTLPVEECEMVIALTANPACGWVTGTTYLFIVDGGDAYISACRLGEWVECSSEVARALSDAVSSMHSSTAWGGRDFCSFHFAISDAQGVRQYSFVDLRPEPVTEGDGTIRNEPLRQQHNALVALLSQLRVEQEEEYRRQGLWSE